MAQSDSGGNHDAAKHIVLEPDAIHEQEGGLYIDCPACGSATPILTIVETGHCSGYVEAEMTETGGDTDPVAGDCRASLSLELVWED
ncbi:MULTISPECIES: hypothetical protein [unclassified Haladaptatus]|uniref:hypothetical protein n=1 Tax=unclassified Haladaptatus TaxID=2622732 RepID=UPI0023E886E3|nr:MULTISPECIES: hypothetical protein [unclassified Haladaptatus]